MVAGSRSAGTELRPTFTKVSSEIRRATGGSRPLATNSLKTATPSDSSLDSLDRPIGDFIGVSQVALIPQEGSTSMKKKRSFQP